jgi:hypothetical protein
MTTLAQRSFAGGEMAPSLYARVDTVRYATGLRTARNVYVMRHGGATNRPGTEFVAEVKDSTKRVREIKFEFNSQQTYVLEFGEEYMRVIQAGSVLTEAPIAIEAITQANPAVVTMTAHPYVDGEELYLLVSGNTSLNGRNVRVVNSTVDDFEMEYLDGTPVDGSAFPAFVTGTAARVYEITTPYQEEDLQTIQFVQSADVITLVHPNYQVYELSRMGDTNWSLDLALFAPSIAAPTGVTNSSPGSNISYVVTSVKAESFEESLPSTGTATNVVASTATPVTISWTAEPAAQEYNVYKQKNGIYGFIGIAGGTSFVDDGITAETSDSPPTARDPFVGAGNYPSAVTFYQQRRVFANQLNDTEKVFASRSGQFSNYTVSVPLQDDDAITFTMAGRQVNAVKHLLDLGTLVIFTQVGEHTAQGDDAGILKPTAINPKQHTYNGSGDLSPIVINGTALYVQARGSIVRDLGFEFQSDGYRGNDLTIYSSHLVEGHTLQDWDYQQTPHSIVWAVRDDGVLLSLTYIREQQMLAWTRHDLEGAFVENVSVIPEGDEDYLYLVVRRVVDGRTVRYIERLSTRRITDIKDSIFMDSALSFDGRNTDATKTMTLSGSGWTYEDSLNLTHSSGFFTAGDIGNQIQITGPDGDLIRFSIEGYTSATVVTGKPHKTVPVSMRAVAISSWAKAVDVVRGLWHLEGKDVSVFADAFVVANPNNEAYDVVTVTDGAVTLDRPYAVIHIGLPYTSDVETLDIDSEQSETLAGQKKKIGKVVMYVEKTRGIWAGSRNPEMDGVGEATGLTELKARNSENYDEPVDLKTETVEIVLETSWNSNGRVFIRQTDPLPMTILSICPDGQIPFRKAGS